jgi:hypothetical protein
MPDSQLNWSERRVQRRFSIPFALALILLPALLIGAAQIFKAYPSRQAHPDRSAEVTFERIEVAGTDGAWAVSMKEPRFGGVSALALQGRRLLALTDSGVLFSLPRPGEGRIGRSHDLPDGPGPPNRRRWRDSESLLQDPAGHWWVTFENRHSLWRFDPNFRRSEFHLRLRQGWAVNKGAEAVVIGKDGRLVLIPEVTSRILRVSAGGRIERDRLTRPPGEISDATRLPDGRVLVLVRQLSITGIHNWIATLEEERSGPARVRLLRRVAVGPLTNLEAMVAEPLPTGATRLWIMSDNDFSDWRRTILLAIDLPKAIGKASPHSRG